MKNAVLWKRILNEGPGHISGPVGNDKILQEQIITSPIIVDSRPFELPEPGWGWEKYSRLSIPFTQFWIEGAGEQNDRWGALVVVHDRDGGKHHLNVCCFCASDKHGPFLYGQYVFDLDSEGTPCGDSPLSMISKEKAAIFGGEKLEQYVLWIGLSVMDTLQMLGCKNIHMIAKPMDEKLSRVASKRHGGNPGSYRYHVLVVRPAGARSDSPAQEIGTMPRHVCRGHFAEYGPEFNKGLLFGRYAGRFFIPPHLKGDKKNGVVEKDYEVRTPALAT
jgi:hypothetical protein